MPFLAGLFRKFTSRKAARLQNLSLRHSAEPTLECLEDRVVPTTSVSSIVSNFNGNAIPAGDSVWFSSVFKASGVGSSPVVVHVTNQEVDFSANGTNYAVPIPDANITIDPSATLGSTSFNGTAWNTTVPKNLSGNGFLSGGALTLASGLPGGINPVTWKATFSSDTSGITINWQWAAAVYTPGANFSNLSALNVKPVDSPNQSAITNSDHAGTPELNKAFVTGGARGGGGSNATGSYSATASVVVALANQPITLSGSVFLSTNGTLTGLGGVTMTLTGMTTGGQLVSMTTTTLADGSYSFTGILAGSYTVTQNVPGGLVDSQTTPGTVNGQTDGTVPNQGQITQIALAMGNNGINYNFVDVFGGS
jgi:hypothetical protein